MIKVLSVILLTASFATINASAEDKNICRNRLLDFLKVDTQQTVLDVSKPILGTVTRSNVNRLHHNFDVGATCPLELRVYQTGGAKTSVFVTDPTYSFNPFNHSVGADNSEESCSGSNVKLADGSSYFQQPDGWHNSFGTEIRVEKINDDEFTVYYGESEDGGSTIFAECRGRL